MCLLSAKIASAQVAVIAHKDVPVDTIKRSDLLNLYTPDIKSWNNGTSVIVFDLKEKSDEKEMFYEYLWQNHLEDEIDLDEKAAIR